MRRSTVAALAATVAVAVGTLSAPSAQAVTTYPCIGAPADEPNGGLYPEPRSFVDAQAWWVPEADQHGTDHGHVHGGSCIPERQTLNAAVTPNYDTWFRVTMHDNPGKVTYSSLVFKTTSMETTVQKATQLAGFTCPVGTCTRWVRFTWPLSAFDHTGLQEIRFRTFVNEPDGKQQNTSINFQLFVTGTGKSLSNVTRMPYLRGKGWYTSALYCAADFLSVPVPMNPVSGTWTPQVQEATHSSDASLPVTSHITRLDPDFHAVPPVQGTTLADGPGPLPPTTLSIDTTQLANGVHRLHLRSNCRDSVQDSTNSGVLSVPFVVANP